MAYQARMSDLMFGVADDDTQLPANTQMAPVTLGQSVLAWFATGGVLILLAAGVVVAALVWFVTLAFLPPVPDEAAGE